MILRSEKKAAAIALCSLVLALPADCGPQVTVVHRFELQSCPDDAFSLPDSVRQGPYRLSSHVQRLNPVCPGFKAYDLLENDKDRLFYYVRLNRRPSCSLDVAYAYLGDLSGRPEDRRKESDKRAWVQVVAQLVAQDSVVARKVPAVSMERFTTDRDRKRWCARTTDSTGAPRDTTGCD